MFKKFSSLFISLLALSPRLLQACSVCFGGADGDLKRGFTWGVLVLGSLPFILMAVFITRIVIATRKHGAR